MTAEELTKGERTHAAIVAAAHDLFITQGYNATSMRQIARKAGIALGGIYNHFSSKAEIFESVFIENHPYQAMLPAIETAQGDTVEEFIRNAAKKMLEAFRLKPDFLNLWFIEIVEFKSVHAVDVLAQTLPRGLSIIERISTLEGDLRPIPPQMLIRAFIGLFFSYFLAEYIFGQAAFFTEFTTNAIDYHVDIFLHGILKPDG